MSIPTPSRLSHDDVVEFLIAEAGGDVRDALSSSLKINRALMQELRKLTGSRAHERADNVTR